MAITDAIAPPGSKISFRDLLNRVEIVTTDQGAAFRYRRLASVAKLNYLGIRTRRTCLNARGDDIKAISLACADEMAQLLEGEAYTIIERDFGRDLLKQPSSAG